MRAFSDRVVLLLLGVLAVLSVGAAEPRWPTSQEIDEARSRLPMPSPEDIGRQKVPWLPNIELKRPDIDIEGIARRYTDNRQAFEGVTGSQPTLKIFVTLAMPEASLRLLVGQAARTGATIVLRGLKDDSMNRTLAAVQRIIGNQQVAWQIDPPAFARFRIKRAPTFVLLARAASNKADATGCKTGCELPEAFVGIAGDVSLDYALEFIARRKPAFSDTAERYLQRLRG